MNQLLFDRSTGNLGQRAFARIQTSQLVHSIEPAPRLRFNGGEKEALVDDDDDQDTLSQAVAGSTGDATDSKIWAHQSGVNALAIDIENKMYQAQSPHFTTPLTTSASSQEEQTRP